MLCSIHTICSAISIITVAVFFLCSVLIIMSHVTVITTTPPVALVPVSTTTIIVIMVLTSIDLAVATGHNVVLSPTLIPRDKAYANYVMGPPQS